MGQKSVERGPTTRRRRADAARSIDAILDAALESIRADGELNMTAIARKAGVSRVTLYAHFPTRDAVLTAAIHRALHLVDAALLDADLTRGPAPQALSRLLDSSWRVLARQRNLFTVASKTLPPAQLRKFHQPVLGSIAELIARGPRDGEFRTDLPRDWLVTTIYTLLHLAAEELNAGRLPADRAGAVATATIQALLAAEGSG